MTKTKYWLSLLAISVVLVAGSLAVSPIAIADDDDDVEEGEFLIAESTLLDGLGAGSLFPYIDTTPNEIVRAHVAITDVTEDCGGDTPTEPDSIVILAGEAGVELVEVTLTNTGIPAEDSDIECVFHATIIPGEDGIPSTVTDIVVVNGGASALTGINTITVSAEVGED